jgi:hypothetical protein
MILEGFINGVTSIVQEAIKIRPQPSAKKPAQEVGITDAPRGGKPARSIDFSRLSEGGKRGPDASPLSRPVEVSPWANWPVVHSLGHLIAEGRHRMFGTGSTMASEPEPMILHREVPSAVSHLAKDAGTCGLCISYNRLGQKPLVEFAAPCPGCGRGRGHEGDCPRVLADNDIRDEDWVDLPGQVRFDEWADANERRGFLL